MVTVTSLTPKNACCMSARMSGSARIAPLASNTEMPSSSSFSFASSVGAVKRMSIVLSEVPASLPLRPRLAKIASAVVSVSMDWLDAANTAELILNESAKSCTSKLEALAAAASRFVTRPVSSAAMLNACMEFATISADCARLNPPAAAKSSTAEMEDKTCCGERPDLPSSSIACAASPAENDVTWPSSSARACSACISSADAEVTTRSRFMLCSKSPALLSAATPTPTSGVVTPSVNLPPRRWRSLPKRSALLAAAARFASKPLASSRSLTLNVPASNMCVQPLLERLRGCVRLRRGDLGLKL